MPFANPWALPALCLFVLLLLAAVAVRRLKLREEGRWGTMASLRRLGNFPAREWDFLRAVALWTAFALTALAFARPQWGEVVENVQKVGLDVVILLDTSRSMDVTDVAPSRLERARMEIRSYLASAGGDRVGLVAAAGVPVTLSPLTEDAGAISLLLDIAGSDLIPAQGTDIGKGIEEALRLMPQPHERDQVILLFSDGEDLGSNALAAARTAARLGVRIFAVGVGTQAGGAVLGPGGKPMADPETGGPAVSRLHEETLRQLAALSDGRCWVLSGGGSAVPKILDEMSHLKKKEYASRSQAQREEKFGWFLSPAFAMLLLFFLLPERGRPPRVGEAPRFPAPGPRAGLLVILAASLGLLPSSGAAAASPFSLAQQGRAAYASGKYEQALGLYRRALQENSRPSLGPVLHYDVGTCLLALGRASEAKDEFTLALAGAEPGVRRSALYNLAQALSSQGERDRAMAALRLLLAAEPENREAKVLYEWLLRQEPPPPPPPSDTPPPPPQTRPPDVLEQLPMPEPKELQDQLKPPEGTPPGMKPW
jgi:Ca-activated chloride channel family protein